MRSKTGDMEKARKGIGIRVGLPQKTVSDPKITLKFNSQHIGTLEPMFANLRHNKRQTQLIQRGQTKVRTQWIQSDTVHGIKKLSKADPGNTGVQ